MTKLNSVLKKNSQLKMALCALIITDDSEILKNENVQLSSKEKRQFCDRIIGTAKLIKGAKREAPEIIMKNLKAERTAAEKITHDILSSYELGDMSTDEVLEISLKLVVKALLLESAVTRDIVLKAFPEKVSGEVVVEEKNSSSFRSKKTEETTKHQEKAELVVVAEEKTDKKSMSENDATIHEYLDKLQDLEAGDYDDSIEMKKMLKEVTVKLPEELKKNVLSELKSKLICSETFTQLINKLFRFVIDRYDFWVTYDKYVKQACMAIILESMLDSKEDEAHTYKYVMEA